MKQVDLTINILSYNRKDYLIECLQSVLSQTIAPKLIVINDNGSNEDVYNAVLPFINETTIWRGTKTTHDNLWNFSRAVKNLETNYVMVLHDDDRLMPNYLETQFEVLDNNPGVLALSANGTLIDSNGENLEGVVINTKEKISYFNNPIEIIDHSLGSCIPMSPIIYNSDLFKSVTINRDFGKCCDSALYLDIIKLGPIVINNTPIYECRVHEFQDSVFFPLKDFTAIFNLYYETSVKFNADSSTFNSIYKKFTSITISRIYNSIKEKDKKYVLLDEIKLLFDRKFKWMYAFLFFVNKIKQ